MSRNDVGQKETEVRRRRWLQLVTGFVGAILLFLVRPRAMIRENWVRAGILPEIEGWHPRDSVGVWLVRDSGGRVAALERRCPHMGCTVHRRVELTDLWCPCHGSRFTEAGERIEGPTPRGLAWFAVRVDSETVWVDLANPYERPRWTDLGNAG